MFFHIEERRAWVRAQTHTVILDRDPAFQRFAADPTGRVKLMLRIWFAEDVTGIRHVRDYLGIVTFCDAGPHFRDLRRLFRFTSTSARRAGVPARTLRRALILRLRAYAQRVYGTDE